MIISIFLSIILMALGLIHFYWVFGGTFGFFKPYQLKKMEKES
jgi:hypothetical protein